MMVRVLLYGYATGVYSSRKIQAKSYDDVAFRFLAADEHPDHSTLAEFRKRHLQALAGLFTQALQLCAKAGLVKLGHVAIDGTKIKANASKHKAMSYGRMSETEQRLKQEVEALLKQAEETDAAEDAKYGKGKRGDELPEELARRESRLKKIQQAKAELEQEAAEKAEQERAEAEAKLAARKEKEEKTGKKPRGRVPLVPYAGPGAARREGATQLHRSGEPDHAGWGQQGKLPAGLQRSGCGGFNRASDRGGGDHAAGQRQPSTAAYAETGRSRMGRKPEAVSADAGYWSEANATDASVVGIDLHIATGRMKHDPTVATASGPPPEKATPKQAMQHKLRTEAGRRRLQNAQGHRRAGLRPDQGAAKLPPLQPARTGQGAGRMEAGVRNRQPAQAVPSRLGTASGLKANQRLLLLSSVPCNCNASKSAPQRLLKAEPHSSHREST